MVKKTYQEKMKLPEKVVVQQNGRELTVKGPKGELKKNIISTAFILKIEHDEIEISAQKATKREKTGMYTLCAHLRNMIKGVTLGHRYTLKICSGHFPMNVTLSGNVLTVKNFLGEKIPRTIKIPEGVKVTLEGEKVIVESINLELASQTAANMEQLTRITNKDLRVFQDGFYITDKDGTGVI